MRFAGQYQAEIARTYEKLGLLLEIAAAPEKVDEYDAWGREIGYSKGKE